MCLDFCHTWAGLPAGESGARSGNSAACRTYHAGAAATGAKATHCQHAGPTGGDTCGSWCDNYCHLALRNCTGAQQLYKSDGECQAACEAIAADGQPTDREGDTIQCRINNLILAQTKPGLDATYCPRGARDGGDTCAALETCANYCAEVTKNCTGGNQQYGSEQLCNTYCESGSQMPKGAVGSTSGNYVGCRAYHATKAKDDPGFHCPYAGPTGGNTCGSWCDVYCQLTETNCQGQYALYPETDVCLDVCSFFATEGALKAEQGDSVQCRIYYAGRAGMDGEPSAASQCPLAAEWGGSCRDPLPSGCIGGKASTVEDCVSCDAASGGAATALSDLAGLYGGCDIDADCVLIDTTTGCGEGCKAAINGQFQWSFQTQVQGITESYCASFAGPGAICTPSVPTCSNTVPKCVDGDCKAVSAP